MYENVCVVIVHYRTPDLLDIAVESLRKHYPNVSLLIVDNEPDDRSREKSEKLVAQHPSCTRLLTIEKNIYHGPGMHQAIAAINHDFVFFLDSDTETKTGGFLEGMLSRFDTQKVYGVGRIDTVNKRGFHSADGTPIVLSPFMMLRRKLYFMFPPFEHHGMPTFKNFFAAQQQGYELKNFPIDTYISHTGRGTASRYGYGLGVRGKIEYVLNKFGL